ncbi:MAG: alpha/beta hydrolase [Betaproteobacteria bacterium]|nr:alpha/beta hydrolase [Betaproteobacteria bacterium]
MTPEIRGIEHWVDNKGVKLYVWEKYAGSPAAKRAVVLAHGSGTGGRESFDLQVPGKQPTYSLMDYLAHEGFDVFAPDVRGFGRSSHPETHTEIFQHFLDLNAVIDYVRQLRSVEQVGLLAWSYANQYAGILVMKRPETVHRYVAYAMHHLYSPDMARRRPKLDWYQNNVYVERKEAEWKPRFFSMTPAEVNDPDVVDAYSKAAAQVEKRTPTGPDRDRITSMQPWISPKLMRVPTMVIHGQYDDQADLDGGIPFFERLAHPYKKYVVVPNAGHMCHLQQSYAVFQREVASWFRGP